MDPQILWCYYRWVVKLHSLAATKMTLAEEQGRGRQMAESAWSAIDQQGAASCKVFASGVL